MPFDARVYRAFVASPSDVAAERRFVRDVISEWTAIHSQDRAAVLLPVGWDSHSAPEMGSRPQDIINRRLLRDCDLLIAAFWTRVGSPTGAAVSGTVEEIEEHIAAGKETMIYFSTAPVRPDSVDAEQYVALKKFKQRCESRGLYEVYDSLEEFRAKLARQLAVTMIRLTSAGGPAAAQTRNGGQSTVDAAPSVAVPTLSPTARELLKTASEDHTGSFLRVNVFGGAVLQANGRSLNTQGDGREMARWDAAIRELERLQLVTPTSNKREVFELTHAGYELADRL